MEELYDNLPGLDSKFRRREEEEAVADTVAQEMTEEIAEEPQLIPSVQTAENSNPFLGGSLSQLWSDNDDDAYIQTLKQEADDANAAAKTQWQSMGDIANDWMETKQRRLAETKPRYTQQELDDRRAKSTAVSMLTSALANIANGIAVGAGGLNATIPDGYKAAYEHWNDVQKRHDARQAEYAKLTDAYYTTKYGMSKAEYDRLQAEAKTKEGYYQSARQADAANKYRIQQIAAATQGRLIEQGQKHQDKMDELDKSSENTIKQIKEKGNQNVRQAATQGYWANEKQKTVNAGKGGSGVDLEDYRTYNGTNGTVTIPDNIDVEDGYLSMANAALDYLEGIRVTSSNRTEINNKKKALREALTGSNKDKAAKIKKLSTAIANSGVKQADLEAALNTQTQDEDGGTDVNDYWDE